MQKSIHGFVAIAAISALSWTSCGTDQKPLAADSDVELQALAKAGATPPGLEVKPVYRMPTNKPGVSLTVHVFYAKGGNGGGGGGKKPPKGDGGGEQCSDPNDSQAYALTGTWWANSGIDIKYQSLFEPETVLGASFGAIDAAFNTWETAVGNAGLVSFTEDDGAPLPPEWDGTNVVGWRQLVGKDARKVLAVTYTWFNTTTNEAVESDIVYNTSQKWAVNPAIDPGSSACGEQFDVQAIGTHEVGHLLGLDHVGDVDATMYGSAAKGELRKQTLAPGDIAGANAVVPQQLASN